MNITPVASVPVFASVEQWCTSIYPSGKTNAYELMNDGTIVSFRVGRKRVIDVAASIDNIRKRAASEQKAA